MSLPELRSGWGQRLKVVADIATLAILGVAVWVFIMGRRGTSSAAAAAPVTSLGDSTIVRLNVRDPNGRPVALFDSTRARAQLVFVFRSDCPVCQRQKAQWEVLAREARVGGADAVAITAETLDETLRNYFGNSPISVLRVSGEQVLPQTFHTAYVPTTLLISRRQRIRFHHIGLMTPDDVRELRALMRAND